MYAAITDFIKAMSAGNPLLWALLVMATVAATSLALYLFWELVLRLLSFQGRSSKRRKGKSR